MEPAHAQQRLLGSRGIIALQQREPAALAQVGRGRFGDAGAQLTRLAAYKPVPLLAGA